MAGSFRGKTSCQVTFLGWPTDPPPEAKHYAVSENIGLLGTSSRGVVLHHGSNLFYERPGTMESPVMLSPTRQRDVLVR